MDDQQREQGGIVVGCIIAAMLAGLLTMGGAFIFWARLSAVQVVQAEQQARMAAEQARRAKLDVDQALQERDTTADEQR